MADILLSVGMQTGAAETSEFVNQLQGIVNSLNKGEDTVIKMKPVIDAAGFNELKSQLSSIGSMIEQINQKNFNLNFHLDDSQSVREHLGQYQEQIREYVRNVQDAYSLIGQIIKSSAIREMGTDATQYIAPAIAAIEKYGEAVGKLENRLDRTSTAAGAERIATDAQKMYSAIQPLIELARDKGVLSFGTDDFKLPAMMAEANGSAGTLKSNLDSIASSLQILASNIDSVANGFTRMNSGGSSGGLQKTKTDVDEVTVAFRELTALQSQISSKELQLIKLDQQKNAEQINAIRNELNNLKTTYDNLFNSSKGKLSSAQLEQLAHGFEQAAAKARELKAAMEDKKTASRNADLYRTEADALKEYEWSIDEVFAKLKSLQSQIGNKELQLIKLDPQKNAGQINAIKEQLRNLKAEYDNLLAANKEKLSTDQITLLGKMSEETSAKIREMTSAMTDSKRGLNALESRFVYLFSLSNLLLQAVRRIKEMIKTTIELDSAMTQLRVVTNESEAAYSDYSSAVAKTAQEIGASITDLVDSTTVFARLGYSLDDSGALAKFTAMLANVGDIDVSSAQSALTAITKAYGISADQIESVMDKMVIVGNNFPISVAEIAEGMNNAGSALAAAGNSFEQSVALLTAANTTIQNISKSSTGLRTITARIRGTRLELDELGEAIETAKYEEAIDILTKHKVALTDNGEFRATYDILQDIANIWKELSSMEQATIAEQLAGKNLLLLPVRTEMCA